MLTSATWTASQAEALTFGGNLVTINDQAEQDWVFGTFGTVGGTKYHLWIGLNDVSSEGNFVWASGEPVSCTNWWGSQPDNFQNEDCVHMFHQTINFGNSGGKWNDLDNNARFADYRPIAGVVEVATVIPEPSSLLSAALGIAGLAGYAGWRRRRIRRQACG